MSSAGAGGSGAGENGGGERTMIQNAWSFATVGIGVLAMVAITAIVVPLAGEEDASTILGVLVPGVVSLGTAAFGITVAREESKRRGEADRGRDEAQRERAEAENRRRRADDEREQTARDHRRLAQATMHIEPLLDQVMRAGESRANSEMFNVRAVPEGPLRDLGEDDVQVLELSNDDLLEAQTALRLAQEALADPR